MSNFSGLGLGQGEEPYWERLVARCKEMVIVSSTNGAAILCIKVETDLGWRGQY